MSSYCHFSRPLHVSLSPFHCVVDVTSSLPHFRLVTLPRPLLTLPLLSIIISPSPLNHCLPSSPFHYVVDVSSPFLHFPLVTLPPRPLLTLPLALSSSLSLVTEPLPPFLLSHRLYHRFSLVTEPLPPFITVSPRPLVTIPPSAAYHSFHTSHTA